jgi:UDP-N-acetylglucosamine 2-epimerase (non-hydrolysing)
VRILHVVGARPNFMKIAPVLEACRSHDDIESLLVHSGQHYDEQMSKLFFDELGIPKPDLDLEVGSGSHAKQTALIMERFEPVLRDWRPDLVVVVGDVNSTMACSLVAVKEGVPVAHVEAGLRSFDRTMPEEINRMVTDAIADLLFVTESSGVDNLRREGVDESKIHLVGNVMIDTLLSHLESAASSRVMETVGVVPGEYAVLTLHRPSNVDDAEALDRVMEPIRELSRSMPVVFPVHPRTRGRVGEGAGSGEDLRLLEPLGYLDFVRLMSEARLVLTDSGGIQEETTILGVPCVTIRENTERPVTLSHGTNRLAGTSSDGIRAAIRESLGQPPSRPGAPPLWDGNAAVRIVRILRQWTPGQVAAPRPTSSR